MLIGSACSFALLHVRACTGHILYITFPWLLHTMTYEGPTPVIWALAVSFFFFCWGGGGGAAQTGFIWKLAAVL